MRKVVIDGLLALAAPLAGELIELQISSGCGTAPFTSPKLN